MPKRFIDSDLWTRDWFLALAPAEKCAFVYLTTQCDAVGVWKPNYKLAEYQIGMEVDWTALRQAANGNIEVLPNGKWWLPEFCGFQYGELKESAVRNKPHQSFIKLLKRHGLWEEYTTRFSDGAPRKHHDVTDMTRERVFRVHGERCAYCGKELAGHDRGIDHIVPVSGYGVCSDENLVPCCQSCNSKKGNMEVTEFMDKYGVAEDRKQRVLSLLPAALAAARTIHSPKEKDKEKDMEKDKDKKDARIRPLIAYYCTKYEQRTKEKPSVTGQWGATFKRLLRLHADDTIRRVIDYFFAYEKRVKFGFTTFAGKFDDLLPAATGHAARASPTHQRAHCPYCGRVLDEGHAPDCPTLGKE